MSVVNSVGSGGAADSVRHPAGTEQYLANDVRGWRARNEAGETAEHGSSFKPQASTPPSYASQDGSFRADSGAFEPASQKASSSQSWTRAKHPQSAAAAQQSSSARADAEAAPPAADAFVEQMAKASNPWRPRSKAEGHEERVIRTVKGILNKITPDNFDRLIEQLADSGINSPNLLQKTISQLFDKAVLEPTFCSLYAQCCVALSKKLPQFQPQEGESKPVTFRRVLLNTCQDEFEGANQAHADVESITDEADREYARRKAKLRTLGNIKLIGELYKKELLQERILHVCAGELLGDESSASVPAEINVEAMCVLLETCGRELEEHTKRKKAIESYMQRLSSISEHKAYSSRIRFRCKDVLELRNNDWKPRTEKLEAKKISEVQAEAREALGISRNSVNAAAVAAAGAPEQAAASEDDLFPAQPKTKKRHQQQLQHHEQQQRKVDIGDGLYSAFGGEYIPPAGDITLPTQAERLRQQQEAAVRSLTGSVDQSNGATSIGSAEGGSVVNNAGVADEDDAGGEFNIRAYVEEMQEKQRPMTWEEADERIQRALDEYAGSQDADEAIACVREVEQKAPDGDTEAVHTRFIDLLLAMCIDHSSTQLAATCASLVAKCVKEAEFDVKVVTNGIRKHADNIEDIQIDVPYATDVIASLIGPLMDTKLKLLNLTFINELARPVEDADTRRKLVAKTLRYLKEKGRLTLPLSRLLSDAQVDILTLLKGEAEDEDLKEFMGRHKLRDVYDFFAGGEPL